MKFVALTCRRDRLEARDEIRDGIDVVWYSFLQRCGYRALPIPNDLESAMTMLAHVQPAGLVITGGGLVNQLSGRMDDRDTVEDELFNWAEATCKPLIGVCRGMQALLTRHGARLSHVTGHVGQPHPVRIGGGQRLVNSFHDFGCTDSAIPGINVLARAPDGVIEMLEHSSLPWVGIGWHPEREKPFFGADIDLFKRVFESGVR